MVHDEKSPTSLFAEGWVVDQMDEHMSRNVGIHRNFLWGDDFGQVGSCRLKPGPNGGEAGKMKPSITNGTLGQEGPF